MQKLSTLFSSALIFFSGYDSLAQVSTTYTFSQPAGTYTEISGDTTVSFATGTTPGTNESMDDVVYQNNNLPFPFTFNGTAYTNVVISSNGFITFGSGLPGTTTYSPIVSTNSYNGAVAGFASNLIGTRGIRGARTAGTNTLTNVASAEFVGLEVGRIITGTGIPAGTTITGLNQGSGFIFMSANATTFGNDTAVIATGSIVRGTTGAVGNRIHTIQFRNIRNYATGQNTNCLNYQLKLYEATAVIEIIFGTNTASAIVSGQVGLRGATNTDYNSRTTSVNWNFTQSSPSNSAFCMMYPNVIPSSGLTFKWTPPTPQTNNVGVTKISNPISGINTLTFATIAPKATIKNFGTANQLTPFNITCTINPGGYTNTKSDTLSSGLTHNIKFDSTFTPAIGTSYTIKVYTSLTNDIDRANDTLTHVSTFIFQNYGNDSGYYYANTSATNQTSFPDYSWKDTSSSKNLVLNGIQSSGTTLVGSLNDGYFKLRLKNILLSLNQDTADKHFKYNGVCFDSIFPGTNGIIGFTGSFGATSISDSKVDGGLVAKYALLPLWKDFNLASIGTGAGTNRLSYKATGSELIITYDRATANFPTTDWVSFQIIIGIVTGCGSPNSNFRFTYADTTTGQTSNSFVNNYFAGYDSIPGAATVFRNFIIGYSKNGAPNSYAGFVSSGNPLPANPQTQLGKRRPMLDLTTERGLAIEFGPGQNSLSVFDGLILKLSAAFEGLQSNLQPRARDTVTVFLHDGSASPYNVIEKRKVYLDSVNSAGKKFGRANISFSLLEKNNLYYVVIHHRNSITSWSNSVSTSMDTLTYDFTSGVSQTYGYNSVLINSTASFYSGDVVKDGIVDGSDAAQVDNDAMNFVSGSYVITDLNWDGVVDGSDALLTDNNAYNFVSVISP